MQCNIYIPNRMHEGTKNLERNKKYKEDTAKKNYTIIKYPFAIYKHPTTNNKKQLTVNRPTKLLNIFGS